MKLGIIKRVFAFSCAAVLVFSMSGCVSNSSTDNAKSLGSSGDDYNITEFEEEEVIVDQSIKISFSEKGTVRYEGTGTNLIDFWEYGAPQSNTVYFEGSGGDFLEDYYKRDCIEFAFEYKNMIYFLKRTYDDSESKPKYDFTLYRMNLKGENITKVSNFSLNSSREEYDDDDLNLYSSIVYDLMMHDFCEYEIRDVYIGNDSLVFGVLYYDYDECHNDVYKIDLKSGIINKLMDIEYATLSFARLENDYTYLYISDNDDYSEDDNDDKFDYDRLAVFRIDNKTNENSKVKFTDKNDKVYSEVIGTYDDQLICTTEDYIDLIDNDGNVKTVYDKKKNHYSDVYDAQLVGNYVLIGSEYSTGYSYKCDLRNGKVESISGTDLSKALYSFGDKYICYKEPTQKEREQYEEQYFENMDSIFSSYKPFDCSKHVFWSREEDVLADKHNYMPIKNFPKSDIYYDDCY